MGSFPSASCTRLFNTLTAAGITDAHVSDLMKFRGPNDERAATWEMWEVSFNCLVAEFDAVAPSGMVIVPEARKWVSEWRARGFGRWCDLLSREHRLLLERLDSSAVDVPFWGGNSRTSKMEVETAWIAGVAEARKRSRPWRTLRRSC